jgi:hypothetical protein
LFCHDTFQVRDHYLSVSLLDDQNRGPMS